jgi:hypothetical protein
VLPFSSSFILLLPLTARAYLNGALGAAVARSNVWVSGSMITKAPDDKQCKEALSDPEATVGTAHGRMHACDWLPGVIWHDIIYVLRLG